MEEKKFQNGSEHRGFNQDYHEGGERQQKRLAGLKGEKGGAK